MAIQFEEALELVLADVVALGNERISLVDALGRTLGSDVVASRSLPPADNSAMDGYALRAHEQGVELPVTATIPAGVGVPAALPPGQAARIFTGAPIPLGADTVVAQECTSRDGEGPVRVVIPEPRGGNVRRAGEDVRAGDRLLVVGSVLGPAQIGLLAGQGVVGVSVVRRPVVAILATGDEVHEPGDPLPDGHIYSSNGATLMARVLEAGGIPRSLGIARDDQASIEAALAGIAGADVVLTIGGVSVGEYDFVKEAIAALGGEQTFWTVRVRPGKPNAFGRIGGARWFGLPGNPVSCDVSFLLYVRPAMMALQGRADRFLPTADAILQEPLRKKAGFMLMLRGEHRREADRLLVRTTGPQGSGIQSSMARATCLLALPEDAVELAEGDTVRVILLPGVDTGQHALNLR